MIIGMEWTPDEPDTVFGAGCLDHMIDQPVPVSAPDGSGSTGIVRGYSLRDGGRSMIVDIEMPDELATMLAGRDAPSTSLALGHRGQSPFEYRARW